MSIENEGPIFQKFVDMIWEIMPDADPVLVCVIEPTEVLDEGYQARIEEEEKRQILDLAKGSLHKTR